MNRLCVYVHVCTQLEDPAIRWQMALYKDMPNRSEDTSDPEKTVERVLDIAHVLFHLDQVIVWHTHQQGFKAASWHSLQFRNNIDSMWSTIVFEN